MINAFEQFIYRLYDKLKPTFKIKLIDVGGEELSQDASLSWDVVEQCSFSSRFGYTVYYPRDVKYTFKATFTIVNKDRCIIEIQAGVILNDTFLEILDIMSPAGTNGLLLKKDTAYEIEITVEIIKCDSCPCTVNVPVPEGTC